MSFFQSVESLSESVQTASGQSTSSPKVPSKGSQQFSDLPPLPDHPPSSIDVYGLSFGTVCGICAGVFVKKGAKALAFAFGGVFVLLQVGVAFPRSGFLGA